MELYKAIEFLKCCKDREEIKCEVLKNNISNNYLLAKLDFRTIENYEDVIETLE